MKVNWVESLDLSPGAGHGVDFFADNDRERGLIAVLRGFDWLHQSPESVEIGIRPPDDEYDDAFLADAKSAIEYWVNHPDMLRAHVAPSPALAAFVNG